MKHCENLGIKTRILLVETHRQYPITDIVVKDCRVLGFDYAGAGCNFSLLNMDLSYLEGEYKVFSDIAKKQNKFGLFDNIEDMYSYIEIRNKLLEEGVNLEIFPSMMPMRISIVNL
ncbi:hypothetical protein ACOAKC_08930 [Hathewaya histolytica]|uniref:hypothetical protein n=1 Tax=Hathewaya histolytica TaxID=1498 RepID=UPI003B66DC9B